MMIFVEEERRGLEEFPAPPAASLALICVDISVVARLIYSAARARE